MQKNSGILFRRANIEIKQQTDAETPEKTFCWFSVSVKDLEKRRGKPQFYRFDKPEDNSYPKMVELFCRNNFELREMTGITPIHIDDTVSSLSAILLNDDYYRVLLDGKVVVGGLSVLRPEYLILFKGIS